MAQAHRKRRGHAEQVLFVCELHEDALAFERGRRGVGAHRQQRVEVGVALCEVRVEDTCCERGGGHHTLVGQERELGLHDVPVWTADALFFRAQHDVGGAIWGVGEERQQCVVSFFYMPP
jgi:hypothetical protein